MGPSLPQNWRFQKEESFHQRATAPFLSITTTHRHRHMSQADTAPADDDEIPNITAHEFFSRVPDGVFNLASSYTDLDDYESLHHVIHKNKQCKANWEAHLRQYAHHAKPLFDVFTSVKSLRFVSVRKIDVPRGWELHLLLKDYHGKDKHKSLTHNESFALVCRE